MGHHVCPPLVGWLLLAPVRGLLENRLRMLGPHVRPGMTVLETGPAMGWYSLALARLAGPSGRLVCVDVEPRMLAVLRRRAVRAGLVDRLETVAGTVDDPRLEAYVGAVDFAAALHMVHEVPDIPRFLRRVHDLLRPGARLLVAEPKGHVRPAAFRRTLAAARAAGFVELPPPAHVRGHAALLERPGATR